jgi:sarcosine oxidase, subunit delta
MFQINCPWCGPRAESEFLCGGQSNLVRPAVPSSVSDQDWATYLYFRTNRQGIVTERWVHRYGCGRWLNVTRNTKSHEIYQVDDICRTNTDNLSHYDAESKLK